MTTTSEKSIQQAVDYQVEAAVLGGVGEILRPEQVSEFVATAVAGARLENQRVCLVVPDGTRTCPLPLLLQAMREGLASASQVTVVIALGTHQGMSDEHLARHLGYNLGELGETYRGWQVLNHEFWLPETFTTVGTISADRIAELTRTAD
jgi:nickel-dependent lactate racemase